MQSYHNMVENFNVRKMWKCIRTRTLNNNKPKKIDSDGILTTMRRNTEMAAPVQREVVRTSLDYYRDHLSQYQVQYTPLSARRILQYNLGMCTNLQPSFTALCANTRSYVNVQGYDFVPSNGPRKKGVY